jgi:hypothetical protein
VHRAEARMLADRARHAPAQRFYAAHHALA